MTFNSRKHKRRVAALVGVGLLGAALAVPASGEPLRCEINVTELDDTIALDAVVHADNALEGSYELQVTGSGDGGSSDIAQSGDFAIDAGERTAVGSVTVASRGANYVARLAVTSGGATYRCTKRIAGHL